MKGDLRWYSPEIFDALESIADNELFLVLQIPVKALPDRTAAGLHFSDGFKPGGDQLFSSRSFGTVKI